ncbi:hypothetical protein [Candidatus Magnetomonas plexicatena]|uniref:hypothetical protein n=1 Tax=Candidatus Magnetomonas plexicatena TaxID=2552947 RepID=UPI001C778C4C|nr:hypothetical protein E2O03_009045 [Nitrospirales bacterium LBB_01]
MANDPLAVALGTFVIALVLKPNWEKNITVVILVGVLTGLAFWAKLTNSTLILFIMICLTISVLKKSLPLRNAAIVGLVVVFICALINVPSFLSNLHRYGTLTTMQESLLNRENKATFLDLLSIIWKTFLPIRLMSLWLTQSTWFGGWSFLKPPVFKYFITLLLMASLSGWGYYFVRKTDTPPFLFSDSNTSLQIFVLILCLSAGISWFMIQTYIAWKITGGSAWYAAVVFPFALMFICEGACRFSHKFGVSISILLILSYILIEFYSIVHIMLPVYSGGLEGFKAIYQISTIQPLLLGTGTLFISASILFVVYALTLLLIFIPASKRLERAL